MRASLRLVHLDGCDQVARARGTTCRVARSRSVQLTWAQLRLLQLIYEPFQQHRQWPAFQHVNAFAWHEMKSPTGDPLEPRHVYDELSASGLVATASAPRPELGASRRNRRVLDAPRSYTSRRGRR
jgi:hypothetical protein